MRTKKIKKSLIAVSCLFALSLTSGFAMANASADTEPVSTETFAMVYGASIRKGVEGEDPNIGDTNGIRFTGEISAEEFEKWRNDYTVTAGTFILPYDWYKQYPINEKNCFSETEAIYKWEGKEFVADYAENQPTIIHVPATITATPNESRTGSGESVYQINGSVVNMRPENLNRKYVGVSYIKAGDEYYFAKTDVDKNSRSTVGVAQNILVAEDEQYEAIATEYIETFLQIKDGSVPVDIGVKVYVNNSTGYEELKDLGTKNITLESVYDFKFVHNYQPEDMDGYDLVINGEDNLNSSVARVDETVTLKYYYDKQVEGTVIFDGSDPLAVNNITIDNGNCVDGGLAVTNDWGYHGNTSILLDDYLQGKGDIATLTFNTPIKLVEETNVLSFTVRLNDSVSAESGYPTQIQLNDGKNTIWGALELPEGVGEVVQVEVVFSQMFSSVSSMIFFIDDGSTSASTLNPSLFGSKYAGKTWGGEGKPRGEDNPCYIDYIQAEYNILRPAESTFDGYKNVEVEEGNKNGAVSVDLGLNGIKSTKFSDKELSETLSVTRTKLASNEQATKLEAIDGSVTIPVAEECNYQIDVKLGRDETVVNIGSFYVLGYFSEMFSTFDVPNTMDGETVTVYGDDTVSGAGVLSDEQAVDGEKSVYLNSITAVAATLNGANNNGRRYFGGIASASTEIYAYKTLSMWIYSSTETTIAKTSATANDDKGIPAGYHLILSLKGGNTGQWAGSKTTSVYICMEGTKLQKGWNYVELNLGTNSFSVPVSQTATWGSDSISVDGFIGFQTLTMYTQYGGTPTDLYGCYIDRIAFKDKTTYTPANFVVQE